MKSEAAESFRHGSREESGQLYFVRRHKKYRSKRHVACSDVEYRNSIDANASRFLPKTKSKPSAAPLNRLSGARLHSVLYLFLIPSYFFPPKIPRTRWR